MKNRITAAIESLGTDIRINGKKGKAVFSTKRYAENFSGGTVRNYNGMKDPHRVFIYANTELLGDAVIGDIVRDGSNEYYVLWVDDIRSKYGGYSKAFLRKFEDAEDQI